MSLSPEILTELKNKLALEKERLENEINRITKPSLDNKHTLIFDEIGSGEDENASEIEEYSDNLAIEGSLEKQLRDTQEALDRINNNSYGKCEFCGAEILTDRLMAYPSAKKCTNC